jgi:hypothetical protein
MVVGVADTHVALWHLLGDTRLSHAADAFSDAGRRFAPKNRGVFDRLVDVVYLVEKRRIPLSAYRDLVAALADPYHLLVEAVLSASIA